MVKKICLVIFLAEVFLNPLTAVSATSDIFDQFTDALNLGLFQGAAIDSELIIESTGDVGSTQGINIISDYYFNGAVVQKAIIENDLYLTLSDGDDVVQGINIYRKGSADNIAQLAIINGSVTMTSKNNSNSIQGINVITNN